jgi:hypothetical protein
MPPQQPDRLLDLFDELLDFRAHGFSRSISSGCSGWPAVMQPFAPAKKHALA